MKLKIWLQAAALLFMSVCSAQAAVSILEVVGEHPFSRPLTSEEDLQDMILKRSSDVREGMSAAGYAALFPQLKAHIERYPKAPVRRTEYAPGEHFQWMLYRPNGRGRVHVLEHLTWGGKNPLPAFEFFIERDGLRYIFAVPYACGNLALKEVAVINQVAGPTVVKEVKVPVEVVKQVPVPGPTVYVDRPVEVVKQVHVPGPTVYVDRPLVKEVKVPVPGPTVYVDRPVEVVKQVQVPVPGPTVYVDRPIPSPPVIKEVKVPVEVVKEVPGPEVIKEVIKTVPIHGPTVVKEVTVPGPTVYVDRPVEVVKEVPGPEVIKEVPGPTVYVDRPVEVVKEVPGPEVVKEVPGPTVYVDRPVEVVKEVPGPEVIKEVVKEIPLCCSYTSGLGFVADAGYLRRGDTAEYGFGRLGLEYAVTRRLSLLAMAGGAGRIDDDDEGENAFLIDFLTQYDWFYLPGDKVWSPVFIGLGFGGWITSGDSELESENSKVDVIVNIGTRLCGESDKFNSSLFLEARSGVDEMDKLSDYGRFGAGLRFRF